MRILIILVLLSLLAAVMDFYEGKIPNLLILTGCCYGLIRMIYYHDVLKSIPGILFPIIVLFPIYKIGVIGAGDIKLFSMIGFYFTFMETLFCIFTSFVLGAVFSAISIVRHENFLERMTYLFSYIKECFFKGHFLYYYSNLNDNSAMQTGEGKTKINLAIPICLSVLLHVGGVL